MTAASLKFLSPQSGAPLDADVELGASVQDVIDNLIEGQFLKPASSDRSYSLVLARTGQALLPQQSLEQAGVQSGDHIEVTQSLTGALRSV